MNEGIHINAITRVASADMSRGTFVQFGNDTANVVACSASDSAVIGVLLNDVKSGDNVAVELLGVSNKTIIAKANGVINAGDEVALDANGKCQSKPNQAGTYVIVGRALGSAVGIDDFVEIAHHAPKSETVA